MRIIADSNGLLSAAISEGPSFDVVNLIFSGAITLVFSRETFGELGDVLMTRPPFDRISKEVRAAHLGHLAERAAWSRPVPQPVKCRDQHDQVFLDLAVSGDVDYLVTGDKDLLSLDHVGKTKIRTPRQFLGELKT